ncbi:MAG: bifunctional folylpolyglutamate synthase/dihydrofolate synthase [Myxococcota bacterium]
MHEPAFLQGRLVTGMRASLEPLRACLTRLGEPQRNFPALLISGTNGKGSVSVTLAACVQVLGVSTGLLTSPSLRDLRELVRINGRPLHPLYLEQLSERVLLSAGAEGLTLFELLTAVAFVAFSEARVELAVVEVGMGGLRDATNLCEPVLSLITRLALDHVVELGGSLESIVHEKLGVARPGRPLITGATGEGRVLLEQGMSTLPGAELRVLGRDFWLDDSGFESLPEMRRVGLEPALMGGHQRQNLALVLESLACLERAGRLPEGSLQQAALVEAVRGVYIPGRLEPLTTSTGFPFLLDGAHNPDGAEALARALSTLWRGVPGVAMLAIFADKDVEGILEALSPVLSGVVCVQTQAARCLSAERLGSRVRACRPSLEVLEASSVLQGLTWLERLARARNVGGVVAGSLSLVAEVHDAVGSTLHLLEPGGWQP